MEIILRLMVYFMFVWVSPFLINMPMFIFHLFFPRAHFEAPVCGFIILPGFLLKLGGYGLFRFFPVFF